MGDKLTKPGYIFEVSWEVCNKVGGIHTVISTKTLSLLKNCEELIMIGPDIWHDSKERQEFEEDHTLFAPWKKVAEAEGFRVRTGRWKVPGAPIVLLIDFSNYINDKDRILYEFWEKYKLDSLSGQWDYIEPALFGYAAGKVIESFVNFNLSVYDKIIAQFHEWMTGTGVLYLEKNMPQIATVFTTHATVVGRCIAGNGYPLYKNLKTTNGDVAAKDFNVISKHSLEKLSAQNADAFTTVSEITAEECAQLLGKEVDIVTPNGFENNFVPEEKKYNANRKVAREKFIRIAEILSGKKYEQEPVIIATSGRYEMHNKGYDLFIEALGKLNKDPNLQKEILAYILVPGNNYGVKKSLYNNLNAIEGDRNIDDKYLTHNLHDVSTDPVITMIKENGLFNNPEDKVKIIFVPSYLNGNDGIFNLPYYDLLPGIDLTAFVSYYEPWGYTPLESLAFGIPTITTDLAGFGKWVENSIDENDKSVYVINRTDDNAEEVANSLIGIISHFLNISDATRIQFAASAKNIANKALWEKLIDEYLKIYSSVLNKVEKRKDQIINQPQTRTAVEVSATETQDPVWRKFEIQTIMPQRFHGLIEMSYNLWWTWNYNASQMFKYIDPKLWREQLYNPVTFLEEVSWLRMKELEKDSVFIKMYDSVYDEFRKYIDLPKTEKIPKIAYFSMEYGFNDNLKIFSGGLGILAGDYLKEASDTNTDMVGVGLLYRYGYFKQKITITGEQDAEYISQDFSKIPIVAVRDENGAHQKITIHFPGREVYVKIWRVNVGRIPLFLLDTDTEENQLQDREITSELYGGDLECRFQQEIILGIGGIRALRYMDIRPDLYHCNEGHAAFIGLERLRRLRTKRNLKFEDALEVIRSSTLFTTHTPVPAGHDVFDETLMRKYMSHYPDRLKVSWEDMMKLGKMNPEDDKFSMSYLAANVSQEINGVSKLHGKVSQEMFAGLWKGYFPEENHVGYVTNGVHYNTWTAKEWKLLYEKTFGQEFLSDLSNPKYWKKIYDVDDASIWTIRQKHRCKLIDYVKNRIRENWIIRYEDPKNMIDVLENINENVLTIGFARRFATYKRGDLLFRNLERLSTILNNKDMPVQLLFAGKAHPNDKAGQELIKKVVEMSKRPEFLGKIIFIEDYDISLAKKLVQGVDVWLNTPTRPQEASGTSGMKAVMNGVLHFSVLDGWWVEGYRENAGWTLPEEAVYENDEYQNELDSQLIYNILENDIVPLFYKRDKNNVPVEWIAYIKKSIAEIAPHFTTKRMIDDYKKKYYNKLYQRAEKLRKNDYELALKISDWKRNVCKAWEEINVISAKFPDYEKNPMNLMEDFTGEIIIDIKQLRPEDIGVEVIVSEQSEKNKNIISEKYTAELTEIQGSIAKFTVIGTPQRSGMYNYAIRIFAKNDLLPYQQDSCLVMWV